MIGIITKNNIRSFGRKKFVLGFNHAKLNVMPYPCSHFYSDIRLYVGIQKKREDSGLFSFEYNMSPKLI